MLVSLHVKNMALIREAEVEFGKGLNIMTGETGAGKSIVIGSVNIALGTGNFKDYVPEDADYALVELVFTTDSPRVRQMMDDQDIPFEDQDIIITRKFKGGRSVSKVNGETVPVAFVKELSSELIDIHGQHEHQSLLYGKNHLNILDGFAGEELSSLLKDCQQQYHGFQKIKREWQKANKEESERAKELDFLQFEVNEIEAAALQIGEDEELEASYRLMVNGQKIMEALSETGALTGANGFSGASDEIGRAARAIGSVRDYDETLGQLSDTLLDIESLMGDFNRGLSDYMDQFTFDEQELRRIEERLDLINRFKTKYGNTIEKIIEAGRQKRERLEVLSNYEAYLCNLKAEYEKKEKELKKTANEISKIRKSYAKQLSAKITEALIDLNFLEVRFDIDFKELKEVGETGQDEICFMISTNPGLPLRPLGSVASGGELSRIMLAIKAVMADKDEVETLIFDEIDTGISGRTAQKVSEKMAVIAGNHQILCITHLAQIAAMADHHYVIEKKPADSKTVTNIGLLTEEESVLELARILGGAKITDTVLQSAREMKELAKNEKKY
ncbi:MAG: DNA repair protein RecN [Lachnospiraceae bacterium]|nr:DNA repair protein RecN [Lachnospiraceae bacterium]MDD7076725.1 DNA repair protein RecN [Lachnospiraceae bacterium]MDY3729106.1 DNA repair protein RecN [Candidatus Choladocola sp.]